MPHDMIGGEIGQEFVALVTALPPASFSQPRSTPGLQASAPRFAVTLRPPIARAIMN